MFRKISHIILSLILLVTTIGLTIDKHYCGSSLISISILGDSESCCDPDNGCCQDVTDTYKLSVDYTLSQSSNDFDQAPVILPALSFFYVSSFGVRSLDTELPIFIPPRDVKTTLSTFQTYRL